MAKAFQFCCWLFVVVAGIGWGGDNGHTSWAQERGKDAAKASNLVSEALHRRIYGLESEHSILLASALSVSPDFAPAHWSAGHVRYMNRWVTPDELVKDESVSKRLSRYEYARGKVEPTVVGYMTLANWCAENSLPLQERAHLFQVIDLAPNHAVARQRLGFVFANGEWIETQTIWKGMYDEARMQAALAKWQKPIEAISKGLKRNKPSLIQTAQDRLAAINDPEAICALEQLAADSSGAGQLVIEAISQMQEHEASTALVRQAVFSTYPRVRQDAAKQLATRSYDHYVPGMLAEMATPIESRFAAIATRGRVLYRHIFFRESQSQNQLLVLDTRYRRVVPVLARSRTPQAALDEESNDDDGDSGPSFEQVVMEDLQDTFQNRERQRQMQNAWINAMNNRICHVLRMATGQQLPSEPKAWWQWWDQESQVQRLGQKPTNLKQQEETKTFVQPTVADVPQSQPQARPRRRCECFAAGTPVLTASGMIEIERLAVGDLVLAKHPDTGELAFRPVLATTIRPPEQVVKIHTTGETIEATSGHPLWIDGEGWAMAGDLRSGMVLHGLERGVMITDLKPGETKRTYNLIVDGFHSYFVGFDHVLVHDNTPCRPTNSVVPGLALLTK